MGKKRLTFSSALLYLVIILLAIVWLIPMYVLFRNALMLDPQITSWEWIWWSIPMHWENFKELFADPFVPMLNGFRNSAVISAITVVFETVIACMAGYALARINVKGRGIVFGFVIATMLMPMTALFVPQFVLIARLGGVNSWWGLIAPGLFNAFNTFMFRQFFLSFPRDLEDAGRADGLGYFGVFRHIALPNAWSIVIALGSLSLVNSWNSFLWPLVIGQGRDWWTVQVNISTYLSAQVVRLNMAFAGAFLGALPMLIAFFILQRYIAEGITHTGIKG